MNIEKMREEFEAWAARDAAECGVDLGLEFDAESNWFVGKSAVHMNLGWAAWQASRKAVVIELPGQEKFTNWGRYSNWRLQKITELEAAGLKVKP